MNFLIKTNSDQFSFPVVNLVQRLLILSLVVVFQISTTDLAGANDVWTTDQEVSLKSGFGMDAPPRPRFQSDKTNQPVAQKQDAEKQDVEEKKQDQEEKDLRPKITRSSNAVIDKNKTLELTFDDIAFEMEKGDDFQRSMLTEEIKNLDNQKIRLRGFIRPSVKQSGLTKFVFVRDNQECCFGPGAAIFDCVLVELDKGKKTDFTVRPVTIEGEFFLKEFKGLNGKIWAIYRMKKGVVK